MATNRAFMDQTLPENVTERELADFVRLVFYDNAQAIGNRQRYLPAFGLYKAEIRY